MDSEGLALAKAEEAPHPTRREVWDEFWAMIAKR